MLSGLRRIINSTIGKVLALAVLVIIALAFVGGDVTQWMPKGTGSGSAVATVGGHDISESEVISKSQQAVQNARQQNPTVTMQQFLDAGALDDLVDDLISAAAMDQFADKVGVHISDQQVDGKIASIPVFKGLNGKFDQKTYDQFLASRGLTSDEVREEIKRGLLGQLLLDPVYAKQPVPLSLATPYAQILLEKRFGNVLLVPAGAWPSETPSEADIQQFYKTNAARYNVPERRVLRYALVDANRVQGNAEPSEAEIAAAYKANAARYAPSEQRSFEQVIVADQAGAAALADKLRKGAAMAVAARAAGLEPSTVADIAQADYAKQTSAATATAAFAAKQGDVLTPARTSFGFPVIRVTGIKKIAGKTLDQARADLVTELRHSKASAALNALQDQFDKSIAAGSTFDQIVAEQKLTAARTAPLLQDGMDPSKPAQPDASQIQLAKAAFDIQPNDPPMLVPMSQDGSFALAALDSVVPAGPPPLAQIHDKVALDLRLERGMAKARKAAADIVAAVGKGDTLAAAQAKAGVHLPPIQPFAITRADLARAQANQIPAPVRLLFAMKPKQAQLTPVEGGTVPGYFVVYLDKVDPGTAKADKGLVDSTRQALATVVSREIAAQYIRAIRDEAGVKRNDKALKQVRDRLSGAISGTSDQAN